MNFEEFFYSANVWGNIDNTYDDPNVKHICIEVTNYDDDDNEIKIGEVHCRLYNTEGEDARILLDQLHFRHVKLCTVLFRHYFEHFTQP